MKTSICITTFNEEGNIGKLLDSLINQTKRADEIIVVDGGSTDKTIEIIKKFKVKLIQSRCTRAKGRNIGVRLAKYPVIAMTDAGCVAESDWLKKIAEPFGDKTIDVVAGFYCMRARNKFEKSEAVFLGVLPQDFNSKFLPSTRSIAFTKKAWEKIGGFPEGKGNSAEDTDFNYKAVKLGLKYVHVKNAIVEWGIPNNLWDLFKKINSYAKWDAEYGIWWHPVQGLSSHNIKALLIIIRYYLGFALFGLCLGDTALFPIFFVLLILYLFWAYKKASYWGIAIQIVSDMAVMSGFISGILGL